MLPFLKNQQEGSMSEPVEPIKRKPDHEEEYDMLESAADDLIAAVHSKNSKDVASALRAAFEICDSEPHYEGSHEEE
jgi:hypothetical protein